MKTLTKENFIEFLIKHEACKPGLDWAKAQVSARDIIEKCTNVKHLQWLILTIGDPLGAEYLEKEDQLLAEYEKNRDLLWAEYDEKNALLWDEYYKKRDQLWAEYDNQITALILEICTFERVQAEIGS